jgi:hypothetical protein
MKSVPYHQEKFPKLLKLNNELKISLLRSITLYLKQLSILHIYLITKGEITFCLNSVVFTIDYHNRLVFMQCS